MRVTHVSEVSWGGVVSLLRSFMAEQVRRGHDVTLLAPAELTVDDPAVTHLHWDLDRRRPATYARAARQLRATVRRQRPDVAHLHSAFAGFFGRLPALSGTGRVAVVYQPHAWSVDLFDDARVGRAMRGWERLAARRTDVVVGNCSDELDEGRSLGIHRPAEVIGVPVDPARFHPVDDAERAASRERLGIGARRVLLCLGRVARQKGQDQLVTAWESDPIQDTALLLVGPGDDAQLRALAPTQWGLTIHRTGDAADVRPYLWACDLLVLPSRYETVAVVVAEALTCARPVVATQVNGVPMALTDGPGEPAGGVVALADMVALLRECRRRLDDPALLARESVAGPERARRLFAPEVIGDHLERAYARALREKAGRR